MSLSLITTLIFSSRAQFIAHFEDTQVLRPSYFYLLLLKMRFSTVVAALIPVVAVSAQQTFNITVGANGTLTYSPQRLVHLSFDSPLYTEDLML